jgi:WD40 repeat protein
VQLESVCSIPVEELLLTRMVFTPDGHHIVIGHRNLTLYDILSGKPVRTFPFDGFAASPTFSSDGRYLACVNRNDNHPGASGLARVFAVDSAELLVEVRTRFPVHTGCFLDDSLGTVFLHKDADTSGPACPGNRVRACRLPSGQPLSDLEFPGWNICRMAAVKALTLFGCDPAGQVRQIEGASLNYHLFKAGKFSYPEGAPQQSHDLGIGLGISRLSPDGRWLAYEAVDFQANLRRLFLMGLETGVRASLLKLPPGVIPALAFSQDGAYFACLSEDSVNPTNLLRLWETGSLQLIGQAPLGLQYHVLALNWPTRRVAALGGGKCDIGLIHA